MGGSFAFERFVLDTGERRVTTADRPIDLNGRYFDALALLVSQPGKLISKDRFLTEVWKGVPVTDEALTQCIRTLRRQLGDDAARPRFIETVPKHGYRFIAPVETLGAPETSDSRPWPDHWQQFIVNGVAGTAGGLIAGVIGGLIYGFLAASQGVASGARVIGWFRFGWTRKTRRTCGWRRSSVNYSASMWASPARWSTRR